jgi:hypothetical protein
MTGRVSVDPLPSLMLARDDTQLCTLGVIPDRSEAVARASARQEGIHGPCTVEALRGLSSGGPSAAQ